MLRLTLHSAEERGLPSTRAHESLCLVSSVGAKLNPRRKGGLLFAEGKVGLLRPSNTRVLRDDRGPACPRCRRGTEVREHARITAELLRKPFYYRRWYYCTNPHCDTRQILHDYFKVKNKRHRKY